MKITAYSHKIQKEKIAIIKSQQKAGRNTKSRYYSLPALTAMASFGGRATDT